MRKSCLDCIRKHIAVAYLLVIEKNINGQFNPLVHIGQAEVLFDEYMTGDYDTHFWLSLGHLALVENYFYGFVYGFVGDKGQKEAIKLADYIRETRIKAIKDFNYRPVFSFIAEDIENSKFDYNTQHLKNKDYLIYGNIFEALEESISVFPKIYNKIKNETLDILWQKKKWEDFQFVEIIDMATEEEEKQNAKRKTDKKIK